MAQSLIEGRAPGVATVFGNGVVNYPVTLMEPIQLTIKKTGRGRLLTTVSARVAESNQFVQLSIETAGTSFAAAIYSRSAVEDQPGG